MFDQLRHTTSIERNDGCATCHCLDDRQPKGFVEMDGMEQCRGPPQQRTALNGTDTTLIKYLVVVNIGLNIFLIVVFILNDARYDQCFVTSFCNFNCLFGTFIRVNTSEKEQSVVWFGLKIELLQVNAMVDGFNIVKLGCSVGLTNGNVKHTFVVFFIDWQNPR